MQIIPLFPTTMMRLVKGLTWAGDIIPLFPTTMMHSFTKWGNWLFSFSQSNVMDKDPNTDSKHSQYIHINTIMIITYLSIYPVEVHGHDMKWGKETRSCSLGLRSVLNVVGFKLLRQTFLTFPRVLYATARLRNWMHDKYVQLSQLKNSSPHSTW